MFSGGWIRGLPGCVGRMSGIVVVGLEECHDLIYGFISSIQNICVRCRNFDKIIRSNFLDILPDFLQL